MTVVEEVVGRTLILRIDRSGKRNAIDDAVAAGLDAGLARLESDRELWVGVLTGGPAVFSAGTDLSAGHLPRTPERGEYGFVRRRRVKPVVAAVEGLALGGGFELVLACDMVVAARTAEFGLPETRRGVVASSGALFRAPAALPRQIATEMLVGGVRLGAERAYALGLVNRLAEAGAALEVALELAAEIERSSPRAVGLTLAALEAVREPGEGAGWRVTADAVRAVKESEDMAEGVRAFLEKREPRWTGR